MASPGNQLCANCIGTLSLSVHEDSAINPTTMEAGALTISAVHSTKRTEQNCSS